MISSHRGFQYESSEKARADRPAADKEFCLIFETLQWDKLIVHHLQFLDTQKQNAHLFERLLFVRFSNSRLSVDMCPATQELTIGNLNQEFCMSGHSAPVASDCMQNDRESQYRIQNSACRVTQHQPRMTACRTVRNPNTVSSWSSWVVTHAFHFQFS